MEAHKKEQTNKNDSNHVVCMPKYSFCCNQIVAAANKKGAVA
jgi:hypothetical protein